MSFLGTQERYSSIQPDIQVDHHGAGCPRSHEPRRLHRHPGGVEGWVRRLPRQALWRQKQKGGEVLKVTHGMWDKSGIVEGVGVDT